MRLLPALALAMPFAAYAAGYTPAHTVPIGAPDGWDYVGFDTVGNRALVSHETEIVLIDGAAGTIVGRLPGIHGAHAAVVNPANGEIWADSGDTAQVTAFDGHTFKPLRTVPAGQDADGMVFDPVSHRIVVMNGDPGTATLVEADGKPAGTVDLGGKPEGVAADGRGAVFAELADKSEIARIDVGHARVTDHWALADCVSPHGLAYDPATKLLFASCLNAKVLVVDAASGAVRGSFPIGHGTDAAVFDPSHHRALIPAGDGTITVLDVAADGRVTPGGTIPTAKGARTAGVDPATGRVFTVTADVAGTRPPGHGGLVPHFQFKPGTTKVLVFTP